MLAHTPETLVSLSVRLTNSVQKSPIYKENNMAKEEKKAEAPEKVSFKERKLKALNEMQNKAKARFLAERLLKK